MIKFNAKTPFALLLLSLMSSSLFAQKRYNLSLNLTPNVSYIVEQDISQEINQEFSGQNHNTRNVTRITYEYQIKDKNPDGFYNLVVVYKKIYFQQGNAEYDSDNPTAGNPQLAKVYAPILGNKIYMKVNNQGAIKDLKGMNVMLEKMMKVFDNQPAIKERMGKTLKNAFGAEAMRESMEQYFNIYPQKPVKIGSSWSKTTNKKAGLPVKSELTWQLREVKNKLALLNVRAKVRPQPNTKLDIGIALARYNLKGEQEGTMDIDLKTGWIKTSYIKQYLKGKMYLTMQNNPEEIEVDATITMISKFKTLDKKE